jgi:hypothetical protein
VTVAGWWHCDMARVTNVPDRGWALRQGSAASMAVPEARLRGAAESSDALDDLSACWLQTDCRSLRQISNRSVLRQRAPSPVTINRNTHRTPVPPVGYPPDRPYPLCRHTSIH